MMTNKLFSTKKGQVTLFIIVGVVVLISAMLFFMMKGNITRERIAQGGAVMVEQLPTEFMPIQPFVDNCLEKTAIDGVIIAGQRGGYIYTDKLVPGRSSTDGNAIEFSRNSEMKLPYWFYLSSDNKCTEDCEFTSNKLALKKSIGQDSLEGQLIRYIDENLGECINDFESIKRLGFDVEERGEYKVDVIIAERDMVVTLNYPLTVSRGESKLDVEDFNSRIDVNLKKIYRMADYLNNLEKDYRFLETAVQNVLVAFSGRDKNKLPPMSESSFEIASSIRWSKSKVRNDVRSLLSYYIPMLRVVDSYNWKEIDTGSSYADALYNYGLAIPNNVSINDLGVNFDYLDFWDIYFDLNCNGEVCEPEAAFTDLLPIGMQRYNFAYDVSFPVMVEINQPDAFDNKGYSFSFMLEGNIRNNDAMQADFSPITKGASEGEMLCEENKRTSGTIDMEFLDSDTKKEVDGVDVIYTCIESCYIGESENGVLETSLPVCFGGTLSFRKEGYETKYLSYDTYLEKGDSLRVEMNPEKTLQVEVRKKMLKKENGEWKFTNEERELEDYENAIITISRSDADKDESFDMVDYKNTGDSEEQEVALSAGTYSIDIDLISEKELYIPPTKKSYDGKDVHIEAVNISSMISGQTSYDYEFDDVNGEKIIFYVLSVDLYSLPGITIDDLSITSQLDDFNKRYKVEMFPRIE